MSRDFVFDESATNFEEVLQEVLADVFGAEEYSQDKEDRTMMLHLLMACQKQENFLTNQLKKGCNLTNSSSQKLSETTTDSAHNSLSTLDILNREASIFGDLTKCLRSFTEENVSKHKLNQFYFNLIKNNVLDSFYLDVAPYACLFGTALNRTIIHCTKRDIGDEILLNTSDLFCTLPQYSLCLDLQDCTQADEAGVRFTGMILSRVTLFTEKNCTLPKISEVDGDEHIFYNALAVMLCSDNSELCPLEFVFMLDSNSTVEDMLKEALCEINNDVALAKDSKKPKSSSVKNKAQEQGKTIIAPHNTKETDHDLDRNLDQGLLSQEEQLSLLVPEDVFVTITEAFKYAVYCLTHQQDIKTQDGQKAHLCNQKTKDALQGKDISTLGQYKHSFSHYYL